VAAAHFFTLQARPSSRRAASTRVPRHHFTRLLAVHHCAKQLLDNFPVWDHAGRTWSPIASRGEHSGPADPSCSLSACCLDLHSLSPAPSTSHRTILLCCPCRADSTQPSNTFHMTAGSQILPIRTAGRRRDPEPSHQRACNSFRTDAPPF
jgi:hypothetical protein